jgi:hypothetical protein
VYDVRAEDSVVYTREKERSKMEKP